MSGSLNLTVASPLQALTEVFTVTEIEHFLGLASLSPEDSERTALLEALIVAAREQAEILQGRDLVEKQWDLTLDAFSAVIELRTPLVSVDAVRYRDSAGDWSADLAEGTDYIMDTSKQPGRIMPPYGGSWPGFTAWPTSAVLVRFTSGCSVDDLWWSDAGARVKVGMKLLIADWFSNRLPRGTAPSGFDPITALLSTGAIPRAV